MVSVFSNNTFVDNRTIRVYSFLIQLPTFWETLVFLLIFFFSVSWRKTFITCCIKCNKMHNTPTKFLYRLDGNKAWIALQVEQKDYFLWVIKSAMAPPGPQMEASMSLKKLLRLAFQVFSGQVLLGRQQRLEATERRATGLSLGLS